MIIKNNLSPTSACGILDFRRCALEFRQLLHSPPPQKTKSALSKMPGLGTGGLLRCPPPLPSGANSAELQLERNKLLKNEVPKPKCSPLGLSNSIIHSYPAFRRMATCGPQRPLALCKTPSALHVFRTWVSNENGPLVLLLQLGSVLMTVKNAISWMCLDALPLDT